jgi:hypothetical protein
MFAIRQEMNKLVNKMRHKICFLIEFSSETIFYGGPFFICSFLGRRLSAMEKSNGRVWRHEGNPNLNPFTTWNWYFFMPYPSPLIFNQPNEKRTPSSVKSLSHTTTTTNFSLSTFSSFHHHHQHHLDFIILKKCQFQAAAAEWMAKEKESEQQRNRLEGMNGLTNERVLSLALKLESFASLQSEQEHENEEKSE